MPRATKRKVNNVTKLENKDHFSNGDKELFKPLLNSLTGHDPFFVWLTLKIT